MNKCVSLLTLELLSFCIIQLELKVFTLYCTFYRIGDGEAGRGGGFGLDLFLLMVLIYYFSTFFRFIIVYVFNPRINKVRKKSKKGL